MAVLAASFNFCLETTNSLLPKELLTLETNFFESMLILGVVLLKEAFARLTLSLDIILVILFLLYKNKNSAQRYI